MSVWEWKRERFTRKVLRRLARQRVELVLPDGRWLVNHAVEEGQEEDVAEALRTCHMRGWVEPMFNAVPRQRLDPKAGVPQPEFAQQTAPMYMLTAAGWSVINREQTWLITTCVVAAVTLVAALLGLALALAR